MSGHRLAGLLGSGAGSRAGRKKASWKKALLVPLLAIPLAIAGKAYLSSRNTASGIRGNIAEGIPVRKGTETLLLPAAEIKARFETSCCVVAVVTRKSGAFATIAGGDLGPGVSTGVSESQGQAKGFSMLREPSALLSVLSGAEAKILDGFDSSAREKMRMAARFGNPGSMQALIDGFVESPPFEGNMLALHNDLAVKYGKLASGYFTGRQTTSCLVELAIIERIGGKEKGGRPTFVNFAVHETAHAAVNRFMKSTDHPGISVEVTETFGLASAIAFGESPLKGMMTVFSEAKFHYINEPFFQFRIAVSHRGNEASTPYDLAYQRDHYAILGRLFKELGISQPLEIFTISDQKLRESAARILDEESARQFGKPFSEILPPKDVEAIKKAAARYYDSLESGK